MPDSKKEHYRTDEIPNEDDRYCDQWGQIVSEQPIVDATRDSVSSLLDSDGDDLDHRYAGRGRAFWVNNFGKWMGMEKDAGRDEFDETLIGEFFEVALQLYIEMCTLDRETQIAGTIFRIKDIGRDPRIFTQIVRLRSLKIIE